MSRRPSELGGPPATDRLKAVLAAGIAQQEVADVSLPFKAAPVLSDEVARLAGFKDKAQAEQFLKGFEERLQDATFQTEFRRQTFASGLGIKQKPAVSNEQLLKQMRALSSKSGFVERVKELGMVFFRLNTLLLQKEAREEYIRNTKSFIESNWLTRTFGRDTDSRGTVLALKRTLGNLGIDINVPNLKEDPAAVKTDGQNHDGPSKTPPSGTEEYTDESVRGETPQEVPPRSAEFVKQQEELAKVREVEEAIEAERFRILGELEKQQQQLKDAPKQLQEVFEKRTKWLLSSKLSPTYAYSWNALNCMLFPHQNEFETALPSFSVFGKFEGLPSQYTDEWVPARHQVLMPVVMTDAKLAAFGAERLKKAQK